MGSDRKAKEKKNKRKTYSSDSQGKKSKDKYKGKHGKDDMVSCIPDVTITELQELSKDDYFSKNNEFATWLKEEKNVFFSELSSESARELFSDFVKAWNRGKLESRYYEGIASGPRTAHNWRIKG
ncbi:style cell-cycle inhibitor 1-A [Senna tora]|uniref:Style cell-cycle inhibitor 1-A n=1 Tax=Senna tora TaxID=362788 RepID=A0A834TKI8_9FABA|nr:style cell-cycle inhibitor 1-A [Senna tora]